jgi:hypothetical protein
VGTDFSGADLTGCRIYGVSAWHLKLEKTNQQDLVITRADEPTITIDNIEVAQFIYLMLNNQKVRDVIDTITSKWELRATRRFGPSKRTRERESAGVFVALRTRFGPRFAARVSPSPSTLI